jgi:D-glycero-alpha-D-manno-heptose-7-phosphate kinase
VVENELKETIARIPVMEPQVKLYKAPITSKSPARISFAGGASDMTDYISKFQTGAVLSTTINLFSFAKLSLRNDKKMRIISKDLNQTVILDPDNDESYYPRFKLIIATIETISPKFGFDLELNSDFPMGSGLGGSTAVICSIINCFNELSQNKLNRKEIYQFAFHIERNILEIKGGWQDQVATCNGGLNLIEFIGNDISLKPIELSDSKRKKIESSLILCFTKEVRNSGDLHNEQRKSLQLDTSKNDLIHENKKLAYLLHSDLSTGSFHSIGDVLDRSWKLKKQLTSSITNPKLDSIYQTAISHGALGGKLLGAGGGGFFLFQTPTEKKARIVSALSSMGFEAMDIKFEQDGLSTLGNNE